MREIKVRCWNEKNKKWDYFNFRNILYYAKELSEHLLNGDEFYQYTGLMDKNDKEIWEGDIVKEIGYPNPAKCIWFDEGAGFVFQSIKNPDDVWCPNSEATSRGFEVIGNIYNHKKQGPP